MRQRPKKLSEDTKPSSSGEASGSSSEGPKVNNNVRVVAKRSVRAVLLYFVLIVYGSWSVYRYQFDTLPAPFTAEQVGKRGFSEHEAMEHVKELTEFGPHPVGSNALDLAVQYVKQAAETIKEKAHWEVDVELDLFHADPGANCLVGGLFKGKSLVYADLHHIVLRISPKHDYEAKESAILVSSHIDTVFSTEGAGDCSSCVAVMLELSRGVSQWAHGFKNAVIFLFNTGEEEGLNGAHSFITQHPWSDTIQMAIDLEAMGIGGRSSIFQAGPHPWAIEKFAEVAKYPSGQVAAQDLFESGAIKSATDFQVYKEVAGLSGLDFAYADRTAVYHTKNDKLNLLKPGSLQHLGDNMLSFLLQAAASSDLPKRNAVESDGRSVQETATYFDILGMYMVVYSQHSATMLNYSVIMQSLLIWTASLVMGGYSAVVSLILSCLSVILMWLFSISFSATIACTIPLISSSPVPYVSNPWLVIGLFGAPAFLGAFTGQHVGYLILQDYLENSFSKRRGNLSSRVQSDLAKLDAERWIFKSGLLQWLILLVIGSYFKIASSYLAIFWLVSPAFAYGLLEATLSPARLPKPLKTVTLLLGLSVPVLISSGLVIRLAATVIGTAVRFERNPGATPEWLGNLIVAVYISTVICLTMVYLLSYIHISGAKVPIIIASFILLGVSLCLITVGVVPPFTEDTARAVNVVHVVDTTGTYGNKQEPISYISLFSTTPGNLIKEAEHIGNKFVCGRDKRIDFVNFSVKYGCLTETSAKSGWQMSDVPQLHVVNDVKGDQRITQVSIDTKVSTRWSLGINTVMVEDFELKDDAETLVPVGDKTSADGWHTIQFSGGRNAPNKFTLTLYWDRNQTTTTKTENKKGNGILLKLRTDVNKLTPPVEKILHKLPSWCALFGKSTSPLTLAFLTNLPIHL
ncbi:metalloprotease [Lithospermum erythrorhizon]|uniref:Vacuolar membrane protease n=1 Tax=Lithospermum erythrorhizon TaxID=34254 RepID=A0AAV3PJE8_LITER